MSTAAPVTDVAGYTGIALLGYDIAGVSGAGIALVVSSFVVAVIVGVLGDHD